MSIHHALTTQQAALLCRPQKKTKNTLCCSAFRIGEYKIKPAIVKSINKRRSVVGWVLTWYRLDRTKRVEERNKKKKILKIKKSGADRTQEQPWHPR